MPHAQAWIPSALEYAIRRRFHAQERASAKMEQVVEEHCLPHFWGTGLERIERLYPL